MAARVRVLYGHPARHSAHSTSAPHLESPMNPDDIPTTVKAVARGVAVGRLEETYSGQIPSTAARDLADHVIAYTWPAIEAHLREQIAQELEQRIRTWPGMGQQAEATNETFAQAARIARRA